MPSFETRLSNRSTAPRGPGLGPAAGAPGTEAGGLGPRDAAASTSRRWDAAPLLRQVGGDLELAREALEMFLEEAPSWRAGIQAAAAAGDRERLAAGVRVFGSSAAAIGAQEWIPRLGRLVEAGAGGFDRRARDLELQLAEALGR